MKKLFTLIFCVLATVTASAQIEILKDGKVVKEGETIEFFAEEQDWGFVYVECAPHEPVIKNLTDKDLQVTILVEKVNPEDQLTICSFGGCQGVSGNSASKTGTIPANSSVMAEIHAGTYTAGEYKTYNAKVTVSCGSFKQTFFEKFIYDKEHATGIEDAQADQVTVGNNQLSYNFSGQADRQLNIYGVSGRLVKSEGLAQQGTVSLGNLHRGVYIYEIVANGKRSGAHKFVVK